MKRKFGLEYLKLVDKKRNPICYDISKNIFSIITKNSSFIDKTQLYIDITFFIEKTLI